MKKRLSILHLEDCLLDSELIEARLEEDGIPCDVVRVDSREAFVRSLDTSPFDLILADYSLPGFDGLAALDLALRKQPGVPFIFVSGAIGEDFAIELLKRGATDYVLKNRLQRLGPAVIRAFHEAKERAERKAAERKLRTAYAGLERRVQERTAELSQVNNSLISEIGERKRAEWALRESEKKLRNLYDTISDGIVMTDMEEKVIECNRRYLDMLGYTEDEIKCTPAAGWREKDAAINKQILSGEHAEEYEQEYSRKDGTTFPVSIKKWPIRDEKGVPRAMWAIVRDITERRKLQDAIKYQAFHDRLTDLPNRALFTDRLKLELAQSRRNRKMLATLFLDLDQFKIINDTLGHSAGDQLLVRVAERLKTCVRESDTVARIGGDEFNILLPEIARSEDAAAIAEKIITAFKESFAIGGIDVHVTPSVGISFYPDDGETAETLLKNADTAMYLAKEAGRNNFQFYNRALQVRGFERISVENRLHRMIDREELVLYFQPQLTVDSRRVVGAEALVRWKHPDLGLLAPARFLPAAEETGFITAIDEWVLDTACEQAKTWRESGLYDLRVTVNLSKRIFQQKDLVDVILDTVGKTGVDPGLLELEITENSVLQNIDAAMEKVGTLHDRGIRFTIDDFGAGYTSLSSLTRLPVRKIKMDSSFLKNIATDRNDKALVNGMIAMSHSLNLRVLAEGVETEEQMKFLQSTECDEVQGFIISKPLSPETFERFIRRGKV